MYVSLFKLFKIGIGPSSSHTVGPINASREFLLFLKKSNFNVKNIQIQLFGSLSYTGIGHGTDIGIISGLLGYKPKEVQISKIKAEYNQIISTKKINLNLLKSEIDFNPKENIIFSKEVRDDFEYSNAMEFIAINHNGEIIKKIYYSIGGGFIKGHNDKNERKIKIKYDFNSAKQLLDICKKNNLKIYELILDNEVIYNRLSDKEVRIKILDLWNVMNKSIYNGMQNTGKLNGSLNIKRRANLLYKKLIKNNKEYDPLDVMDWVNIFAISVSEENASFGKIVTAPTNGAAGIIPAVIKYYKEFTKDSNEDGIIRFLLTSSAIGLLYKNNASISGAEAGCQGEVGVACSMAAGGLAAALNATNNQIENAAEIAMEHNLGLTCDPINGLVQIPCIERNAMGAIKAINACRIAINESGEHKVSLDEVISTMWETGKNMSSIYKETSKGGLAVNVTEC